MSAVYIHEALRTVRGKGKRGGGLAGETPQSLVGALIDAAEARGHDPRMRADRLVLGTVGQVGAQGGHIAMVAKMACTLPDTLAVHTVNNFCASGLSAIGLGAAAIDAGQARWVLAGGVEMLSRVPFMADSADYYTAADLAPERRYIPVALAADLLAGKEGISIPALDAVALTSQTRALAAEGRAGLQASRIAVAGLTYDETARAISAETLASLQPAFALLAEQYSAALCGARVEHRHTIGHSPPLADGAGLALLGPRGGARARILAFAEAGADPRDSLTAGFVAMDQALTQAGLTLGQIERIEFMEAFAVTIAKFLRDRAPDPARVNVGGGHIAKGHPMGATGAILTSSLLDALADADATLGLVVVSGAQGVGAAMVLERLR